MAHLYCIAYTKQRGINYWFETTGICLKVYEKLSPLVIDYIGIPVDSAIHPNQVKVMLGGIVCFDSHLLTREGEW